jgi:ASC-1-like (ASCH) protein
MSTVTKKIDTEWFEMILSGKKKFELRLADFEFQDGDILKLEEWVGEGENRKPTGRVIEKIATYVHKIDIKNWLENKPELLEKSFYVIQFD